MHSKATTCISLRTISLPLIRTRLSPLRHYKKYNIPKMCCNVCSCPPMHSNATSHLKFPKLVGSNQLSIYRQGGGSSKLIVKTVSVVRLCKIFSGCSLRGKSTASFNCLSKLDSLSRVRRHGFTGSTQEWFRKAFLIYHVLHLQASSI